MTPLHRLAAETPGLLSSGSVALSADCVQQIRQAVRALTDVIGSAAWQAAALSGAPEIAQRQPASPGLFLGFDFHTTLDGPKLIEINTNPGGVFVAALLAQAPPPQGAALEAALIDVFKREWSAVFGARPLLRVAIVDDSPAEQYLYREFEIAASMLRRAGIDAVVADAGSLRFDAGRLTVNDANVDFVYNRSTDFYLDLPEHAALRAAALSGSVLVAPHSRAYALFAEKTNLVRLSDPVWLAANASPDLAATILSVVPSTFLVDAEDADALWRIRKSLFFKPVRGFGSKAAYRGDKLTTRVFAELLTRPYVAQSLVPPGEQAVVVDGKATVLKFDVRAFAYEGDVIVLAARLYQGQTTNFRTPGGGFAAVTVENSPVSA